MKIDTALYNNEKRHQLEGYFTIDMILSLSHQGTLAGSLTPVSTEVVRLAVKGRLRWWRQRRLATTATTEEGDGGGGVSTAAAV